MQSVTTNWIDSQGFIIEMISIFFLFFQTKRNASFQMSPQTISTRYSKYRRHIIKWQWIVKTCLLSLPMMGSNVEYHLKTCLRIFLTDILKGIGSLNGQGSALIVYMWTVELELELFILGKTISKVYHSLVWNTRFPLITWNNAFVFSYVMQNSCYLLYLGRWHYVLMK